MNLKMVFILSTFFLVIQCDDTSVTTKDEDLRNLEKMFSEIEVLAQSETCTNASEWKFIAYGSKACGGSQGFVAYSSKIDESSFLKLVENYTNEEAKFNQKWGVISDCSLVVPPSSITCENGKAKLLYN